MGKIQQCKITRNNGVFRPGETICGHATLTVDGDVKTRSVNIYCCGMALTKWRGAWQRSYESDYKGTEFYLNRVIRKPVESLSSGNHDFSFSFQLPTGGLPSSYEGPYGAVRYFLRVEVDKPFPSINNHFYSTFTVLALLDANLPVYKRAANATVKKEVHKAFGLGNAGTLTLSASTDRNGYCPGETILINLEAKNESTKDCGAVKTALVQNVHFSASGQSQSCRSIIRAVVDTPLERGKTRVWHQLPFQIDPVPPSLKLNTCQIVKVTYFLNVTVEVPLGTDLEMNIPLKICTVPLGKSVATNPTLVRPGVYEIAGSKSVNYKVCSFGISKFDKSDGNFVCTGFVPMTAFATGGPPVAAQAASPAAVGATAKTADGASALPSTKGDQARSEEKTALVEPHVHVGEEPPPSYEETMQEVTLGVAELPSPAAPCVPPIYEPGKGAAMVILFPESDAELVRACLKNKSPVLMQHGGSVMAYQSKLPLLPNQDTGAVVIHFRSPQAGLGWWRSITLSDSTLSSRWWVLQGESKVDMGLPAPSDELTALSLIILKRSPDFQQTDSYKKEYHKLLKEALNPAKKKFGGKTVVSSGDVALISGDWSSAVPSASGVTLVVTQWPTVGHNEEYRGQFLTDPGLISYNQLFQMSYQILCRLVFPAGDIEDLLKHES